MKVETLIIVLACCFSLHTLQAQNTTTSYHPAIPSAVIPKGLGVNIHFTDPRPGEMKMLAEAGFHWIRMDFFWGNIEKEKGEYDFSDYDHLVSALDKYHLKAIFILDYGNPLYDDGMAPHSPEAIEAFAKWAAASAKHFAGHGILWEMWNEPNIGFWKPKPDVNAYVHLALATGKAIKDAAPQEAFIGPATSTIPLDFLESCFKAGLLQYWDAVSVHPYRQSGPETVAKDYQAVRQLIAKYAPSGKTIPVISGEWGYSAAWKGFDPEKQGRMIAREFLTNLSYKIPLSIWYDWHDDGPDPKEAEHHFGTVAYDYHSNKDPVYDPKPAYWAVKTLAHVLNGFHFDKLMSDSNSADHILVFRNGRKLCLALWTTQQPHTIMLPVDRKKYRILDYKGNKLQTAKADKHKLKIKLTNLPKYFISKK